MRFLAGSQWLIPVNPSYSGGRDQEDHGSKIARGNSSWDHILEKKKLITHKKKKGWPSKLEALGSIPSMAKQNKNK
jgi:hypothetical protein